MTLQNKNIGVCIAYAGFILNYVSGCFYLAVKTQFIIVIKHKTIYKSTLQYNWAVIW